MPQEDFPKAIGLPKHPRGLLTLGGHTQTKHPESRPGALTLQLDFLSQIRRISVALPF